MQVVPVETWRDFEEQLRHITSQRSDAVNQRSPFYVSPFLFRGQSDATWKLNTTLERYTPHPNGREAVRGYYERILAVKAQIETFTQERWSIPTPTECLNLLKEKESLGLTGLPGYEYWIYLRHHGFPSPLLDWTRSPYVAAFFAFRQACQAEKVAIFAYLEYSGQVKNAMSGNCRTLKLWDQTCEPISVTFYNKAIIRSVPSLSEASGFLRATRVRIQQAIKVGRTSYCGNLKFRQKSGRVSLVCSTNST
jgi:hypothetical protein